MELKSDHIVFGYDGSEPADLALRAACKLLRPEGTVTVIHAYEVPWQVNAYPWFADFEEACQGVAEEVLAKAKKICADYPVAAKFKTVPGKAADVLAQAAADERADLVAVGSRGLGPVRGAIGSVTFRLLSRAHCPVLVIPERELEYESDSHGEQQDRARASSLAEV